MIDSIAVGSFVSSLKAKVTRTTADPKEASTEDPTALSGHGTHAVPKGTPKESQDGTLGHPNNTPT